MSYQISKLIEAFWFFVARRLPRKLVYYCVIVCWAEATCTTYSNKSPDEVTWDMALKAWEKKWRESR